MAYHEIIVAGFGGQGVMSIGTTMAETAMAQGLNVSWLPSYGPEMRGGTANCNVVIADTEIISPIVLEPVSYTHLDVYKRQAHGFSVITSRNSIESISIIGS